MTNISPYISPQNVTNTKGPLGHHFRAIELRYQGKKYDEIAEIVSKEFLFHKPLNPGVVRHWFARNGYLHSYYIEYAKQENRHRAEIMHTEMKKLVPKLAEVFDQLIAGRKDENGKPIYDMVTVAALKIFTDKFMHDNDVETKGNVLDEYFKKLDARIATKGN